MSDLSSPPPPGDDALDTVGALADPVRRALYRYIAAAEGAVGRAEAADAVGIQRTLAAFHLDKLAEARLLSTEYARPAGKGGPGAGRPAKLYRRSTIETSVSLPPRAYDTAGQILADAVERAGADRAVHAAAYDTGRLAGRALGGPTAGGASDTDDTDDTDGTRGTDEHDRVVAALTARGYEPVPDAVSNPASGPEPHPQPQPQHERADQDVPATPEEPHETSRILLRNCPFHQLAEDFPPLVCGMNLALVEGLLDGLGAAEHRARLDSVPGRCCVVVERSAEETAQGRRAANSGPANEANGRGPVD
ncbi:transcriptional regulator (plasmid) [Embleya sp. NBC_00888]|uniref:helix-turn-helix transcriptional regulator n=1 Tax=Embleya sp. NBC_00888 TaxID=2975960 RepID=UPI002F91A79B|nr:transcriptional regulator [Embleya sp. NBC_00888]